MHFYNSVIVSYILFCFEIPYFSIPVYIVYIILLHIFISCEDIVVQHAYNIRAEKTSVTEIHIFVLPHHKLCANNTTFICVLNRKVHACIYLTDK